MQQEKIPDQIDSPVVEFLFVDLFQSGRYTLTVNKEGYEPFSVDVGLAVKQVLADSALVSEINTESVPVFSLGGLSARPSQLMTLYTAITGYSWQGHYNKRGIRELK